MSVRVSFHQKSLTTETMILDLLTNCSRSQKLTFKFSTLGPKVSVDPGSVIVLPKNMHLCSFSLKNTGTTPASINVDYPEQCFNLSCSTVDIQCGKEMLLPVGERCIQIALCSRGDIFETITFQTNEYTLQNGIFQQRTISLLVLRSSSITQLSYQGYDFSLVKDQEFERQDKPSDITPALLVAKLFCGLQTNDMATLPPAESISHGFFLLATCVKHNKGLLSVFEKLFTQQDMNRGFSVTCGILSNIVLPASNQLAYISEQFQFGLFQHENSKDMVRAAIEIMWPIFAESRTLPSLLPLLNTLCVITETPDDALNQIDVLINRILLSDPLCRQVIQTVESAVKSPLWVQLPLALTCNDVISSNLKMTLEDDGIDSFMAFLNLINLQTPSEKFVLLSNTVCTAIKGTADTNVIVINILSFIDQSATSSAILGLYAEENWQSFIGSFVTPSLRTHWVKLVKYIESRPHLTIQQANQFGVPSNRASSFVQNFTSFTASKWSPLAHIQKMLRCYCHGNKPLEAEVELLERKVKLAQQLRRPKSTSKEILSYTCELVSLITANEDWMSLMSELELLKNQTNSPLPALRAAQRCALLCKIENPLAKLEKSFMAGSSSYLQLGLNLVRPFVDKTQFETIKEVSVAVSAFGGKRGLENTLQSLKELSKVAGAQTIMIISHVDILRTTLINLYKISTYKKFWGYDFTKPLEECLSLYVSCLPQESLPKLRAAAECLNYLSQFLMYPLKESLTEGISCILFLVRIVVLFQENTQPLFELPLYFPAHDKVLRVLSCLTPIDKRDHDTHVSETERLPTKEPLALSVNTQEGISEETRKLFQQLDSYMVEIDACVNPEKLEAASLRSDYPIVHFINQLPKVHRAVQVWHSLFYESCSLLKQSIALPPHFAQTIVKHGFKLLCIVNAISSRCGKRFLTCSQTLKQDLLSLKEFLSVFSTREPHPEIIGLVGLFKLNSTDTYAKDFLMPTRWEREENGLQNSDRIHAALSHSADNQYVVEMMEVEQSWASDFSPNFTHAEEAQENIEDFSLYELDKGSEALEELDYNAIDVIIQQLPTTSTKAIPSSKQTYNEEKKRSEGSLTSGKASSRYTNAHSSKSYNTMSEAAGFDAESSFSSKVKAMPMSFDPSSFQEHLKQCNLLDFYSKRGKKKSRMVAGSMTNLLQAQASEAQKAVKWTYQLLAECKPLASMVNRVLQKIRTSFDKIHENSDFGLHQFEWVLMIDNSGSMGYKKNQVFEALVVLIEVLRKLECRFAIVKFGTTQHLLKGIDTPFDNELGEQILESFSFDEGTKPATALGRTVNQLWGNSEPDRLQHRMVLMITDGLTNETDVKDWMKHVQKINFSLLLIKDSYVYNIPTKVANIFSDTTERKAVITPPPSKTALSDISLKVEARTVGGKTSYYVAFSPPVRGEYTISLNNTTQLTFTVQGFFSFEDRFLRKVTKRGKAYVVLDANDIDNLSISLAELMIVQFLLEVEGITEQTSLEDKQKEPELIQPCTPEMEHVKGKDVIALASRVGSIQYDAALAKRSNQESLFEVSPKNNPIPHLLPGTVYKKSNDSPLYLDKVSERLDAFYNDLLYDPSCKAILLEAQRNWLDAEQKLHKEIQNLSSVFENFIFPINKYSKRKAHFRGSSLYLPGLIKAVITDFNYRKFFSVKAAGGKRNYSVCLVLDVSLSMNGHLANCALETLVMLISSLKCIGVDTFSLVLFGETVRILKTEDKDWSPTTILALLSYLFSDNHFGSVDADAIETALDLAMGSQSRGSKKVFVLSDGFGTRGQLLTSALHRAQHEGVEVVGISVGFTRSNVPAVYQHFIAVSLPSLLPEAFQSFVEQEDTSMDPNTKLWAEVMPLVADARETIEEVLKNPMQVFPEIREQLRTYREGKLVKGSVSTTVDLCFCIDCTGSMSPYLLSVKQLVKGIATELIGEIKKHYPSLDLSVRYAFVPYRDFGDAATKKLDFTNFLETFVSAVEEQHAGGGGDEPEDVLGALEEVASLSWESSARYLIWIGDAPGHGSECHGSELADDHPHPKSSIRDITRSLVGKKINMMFCRIKESVTKKMELAFQEKYQDLTIDNLPKFTAVPMFDETHQKAPKHHFVFVLDESGSMEGSRWDDLNKAYLLFLRKRRNNQIGIDDKVSIVQFDGIARTICRNQPLSNVKEEELTMHGGGTAFRPAFKKAAKCFDCGDRSCVPVLIFMSDGEADDDPTDILLEIHQQHPRLQAHMIAFGSDVKVLPELARSVGGKSYQCRTGDESEFGLAQTFVSISTSNNPVALKTLGRHVGENLSSQIGEQIVIDYL
eukprot:TRINITY_DN3334_c0_g4_i1.p1 TRINITY_DN3334_c0_g4~~TRINITY_DN3334_c0_g4_i1.p1  ORF type:complete len:2536 (-),score=396.53 TRINITY_DN3334_c0_g4_i1:97-7002(-)